MEKQAGYTLIEVIAVLILVGVLGAVASTGIIQFVKGYEFSKENAFTTQKVDLAMQRMCREILELTDVIRVTNHHIEFISERGNGFHTIQFVPGPGQGVLRIDDNVLVDNVVNFTISYFKLNASGKWSTWSIESDSVHDLSIIRLDLEMDRPDSGIGTISFTTTVHPRLI